MAMLWETNNCIRQINLIGRVSSQVSFSTNCSYFCQNNHVRVRFAPSPTGFLHLGGLRTALYNFLFAMKYNGKFILRIEDTDQTRIVPGAVDQLQKDLSWSGIQIDEGPGIGGNFEPYIQSQRLLIYREQVRALLDNGCAYHCFCTDRRLQLLRKEAVRMQEIPKYDNRCKHLTKAEVNSRLERGETSCIRFKISPGVEIFNDLIYGEVAYDVSLNEGDPVIMKTDGFPTYHFANVVDDHFMKISHVLRGVEWQISTTKHILLYRAFDWEPPKFGHLPLLMNADGTKLSKRQGDIQISHYRDKNIFPLALINFIVHSGGGFQKDLEQNVKPKCFTLHELAEQFNISNINTHSGKLMSERLLEFNRLELKRKLEDSNEEKKLIMQVQNMVMETFPERANSLQVSDRHIRNVLHWAVNRIRTLSDLFSKDLVFIWIMPSNYETGNIDFKAIESFKNCVALQENLNRQNVNDSIKRFCEENGLKFSHFMKTIRSILSGLKEGPSVAEMMEILGKENTLQRLENCLSKIKKSDKYI